MFFMLYKPCILLLTLAVTGEMLGYLLLEMNITITNFLCFHAATWTKNLWLHFAATVMAQGGEICMLHSSIVNIFW
jgi:hypothetical protein